MADVGRLARVSPTTVSFVVNGRLDQSISETTRQRVLAAVAELGYRPNRAAQGLRTKRTATVGYVTDEDAVNPFAGPAIAGAHDVARRHSSMLLVVHTGRDPRVRQEMIEDLLDRQVDAIVFAVVGTRRVTLPDILVKVPAALVNCFTLASSAASTLPVVLPDDEGGGRAAARLALDAGHRRIAVLGGLPGAWATRARLRGMRRAFASAGVPEPVLHTGNFQIDSGYELTRKVLTMPRSRRPTVLVCGNDRMALGAYLALGEAGARVPEDMSVIGYDDQDGLAAQLYPALSTVRLPYYEMGSRATEQLFPPAQPEPGVIHVPCVPVPRGSVLDLTGG
jgi:LacI family transcriptional regulator, galactose operon repressor